MNLYKISFT